MRLTTSEFQTVLQPLLAEEYDQPDRAFALAAFSFLSEPSDLMPQYLGQLVEPELLLDEVIARSDATRMRAVLDPDGIAQLEESLENNWDAIWGNAMQRWSPRLNRAELLGSLEWMVRGASGIAGPHRLVLKDTNEFPLPLEDLRLHTPGALWCIGDVSLLTRPNLLSVVGTRQASRYGSSVATDIAVVAAQHSVPTVSGGAFGIDAIIHQAALRLDAPTVSLMAGGLANLYPRSHLGLLTEIGERGLLVSEVAPFVAPAKWRFLMRNRLIAALGSATVVVEAGRTSGALNTGRTAVSLGREVAIVPGNIDSSRSVGCHDFLNEHLGSVKVLARPQEAMKLLGLGSLEDVLKHGLGALERRALDAFGNAPIEAWEVQRLAGLTTRETQIALGSLEMLGIVKRLGTAYRRVESLPIESPVT